MELTETYYRKGYTDASREVLKDLLQALQARQETCADLYGLDVAIAIAKEFMK